MDEQEIGVVSFDSLSGNALRDYLDDILHNVSGFSSADLAQLVNQVVARHGVYTDADVRDQAQRFLVAASKIDSEPFVNLMTRLAQSSASRSVSDLLTVLQWTNAVLGQIGDCAKLIDAQKVFFGRVLDCGNPRKAHAAAASTASALETFARQHGAEPYLRLLDSDPSMYSLCIVSLLARAGARAASTAYPAIEVAVTKSIPLWSTVYANVVVGARAVPQMLVLESMRDAVVLISPEIVETTLVPAFSRGLLRAAEVVLQGALPTLVTQLSGTIDLSGATTQLLPSLLSNLNSSNPVLRVAAANCLGKLLARTKTSSEKTKLVVKDLASALKKVTASENRALLSGAIANMDLAELAPDSRAVLVEATEMAAKKEGNEAAVTKVASLTIALLPDTLKTVLSGINDKARPAIRREWVCTLASIGSNSVPETSRDEITTAIKSLLDEALKNVNSFFTAKAIAAAYAALYYLQDSTSCTLIEDPKIFTRLSTEQEFLFATKAAAVRPEPESARIYVHLCCSSSAPVTSRVLAVKTVRAVYRAHAGKMGLSLADAVNEALPQYDDLSPIIKVFGEVPEDGSDATETLARIILPAHHDKAKIKNGWIGLCLHARVDPGMLLTRYQDSLFAKLFSASFEFTKARNAALATLAFINDGITAPKLIAYLQKELKPVNLTRDESIILDTPEGMLALTDQVVRRKQAGSARGGDKDAKWEEELRKDIAKKRGEVLSKEDKAILAEQGEIRSKYTAIKEAYAGAISLVDELSSQDVDNGKPQWFPEVVSLYIRVGSTPLGHGAVASLVGLVRNITDRFAELRQQVGKTLAWKLKLSSEGSAQMLTKVLYRAKFLSDQRPLDIITLAYILPFLISILRDSAKPVSDELEEQLILALNVISAQSDSLVNISRHDTVQSILNIMSKNVERAKDAKDALQRIAQSVVFDDSELRALLDALVQQSAYVRSAVLEVMDAEVDFSQQEFIPEIFISRFTEDAATADAIWSESQMSLVDDLTAQLEPYLGLQIRESVAKAIAFGVSERQALLDGSMKVLIDSYVEATKIPGPSFDEYGIEIKKQHKDPWEKRTGVLRTLFLLVPVLTDAWINALIDFILGTAVYDTNGAARDKVQELALRVVELHGARNNEAILTKVDKMLREDSTTEEIREIFAVVYGTAATHLPAGDSKLGNIVDTLVQTLRSPSEPLQHSVALCMAPLMSKVDPEVYINRLSKQLFTGDTFEVRRGAAYGIAGVCKGVGLASLNDYGIIKAIFSGMDDKKDHNRRHGSQLAIGCLSQLLGRVFEPYALELLPLVLVGLGDLNNHVRDAASQSARMIMSHTTGFGIKTQIPLALGRLDDTAWRGKKGAVELLGTMAYLDPQQLSVSLTTIVPEIVGVLSDTHKEVRNAAKSSLQQFGEVIQNPEIRILVPRLLDAISDPTKYTEPALDELLKTKFVHYIDSPSLALVVHIVKRGLRDRSAHTKRKSCQVVGNMSILAEAADILPYLPDIMPDLHVALTDPVPATVATASKALGVLVEKLGEEHFPQVIPDLFETLKDATKEGDRWGSAQGLSEVIYGLGLSKLEELLPTIIKNCYSPKTWVRAGFILLMLFLPASFGQSITPYLNQLTPAILHGLADTSEEVRENALKAGRRIVRNFAAKAVDLLLPELERGLADTKYRIRLSSVELTGELLFQLAGITRNTADEAAVSAHAQNSLMEALGSERKDRIFCALFICRADTSGQVRNAATDVWMSLVSNTPRTVKETLPTLVHMVVRRIASAEAETRENARRALEELNRRVSKALVQVLPTLQALSTEIDLREGICLVLAELVRYSTTEILREKESEITGLIRDFLTDKNSEVREAASHAFDALHEMLGEVTHDIVPELISQMDNGDESALAALKEMMAISPDSVLPKLIPKLLVKPMTAIKATSLADVAEVAEDRLLSNIDDIAEGFLDALVSKNDSETTEAIATAFDRVLALHAPQNFLMQVVKNSEPQKRLLVFRHVSHVFAEDPDAIDDLYTPEWVSFAVNALDDNDTEINLAAWELLKSLTTSASKPSLLKLVEPAYVALNMTSSPLAGFQLPKGPSAVLPIFLQGLVAGSNIERERSAQGLALIVERTEPDNLKPFVTQMTGPLIRVVGERYSADIKAAIMYTFNVMLKKIPQILKPFIPQLQRTFAKSLSDANNEILRTRAAQALGELIGLQSRLDPLAKEIAATVRASTNHGVTIANLQAMLQIVIRGGATLSEPVKLDILELMDGLDTPSSDRQLLSLVASITAAIIGLLPTMARDLTRQVLGSSDVPVALATGNALLVHALDPVIDNGLTADLGHFFMAKAVDTDATISELAVAGLGKYLLADFEKGQGSAEAVATLTKVTEKDENRASDTRRLSLVALRLVARSKRHLLEASLNELVIPLFAAVRDTVVPVKLAAENAFLDVFQFVETADSSVFDKWFDQAVATGGVFANDTQQRSLKEYVRRVALRHAAARREKLEAGGVDEIGEDLAEIWSV